jgi:hypothetical protein
LIWFGFLGELFGLFWLILGLRWVVFIVVPFDYFLFGSFCSFHFVVFLVCFGLGGLVFDGFAVMDFSACSAIRFGLLGPYGVFCWIIFVIIWFDFVLLNPLWLKFCFGFFGLFLVCLEFFLWLICFGFLGELFGLVCLIFGLWWVCFGFGFV